MIAGIVAAACLSAPLAARADPVEPLLPQSAPPAQVGSLTYVTGLGHLERITREDDLLHPRVLSINRRIKVAAGVGFGGVALGALIIAAAGTIFSHTDCNTSVLGNRTCASGHINVDLAAAGFLTGVLLGGIGVALAPSQVEWYEIINAWNTRHPDRTLLVANYSSGK